MQKHLLAKTPCSVLGLKFAIAVIIQCQVILALNALYKVHDFTYWINKMLTVLLISVAHDLNSLHAKHNCKIIKNETISSNDGCCHIKMPAKPDSALSYRRTTAILARQSKILCVAKEQTTV
jgi:hypothetical protein